MSRKNPKSTLDKQIEPCIIGEMKQTYVGPCGGARLG
jgi:hypothetical protein